MFNAINQGLPIFLASTSPRRHELLNQVQIQHQRLAVDIDETQLAQESPVNYIERMVNEKANAAISSLNSNIQACLVITADTIGVLNTGEVLQKPKNFTEAKQMWHNMSDATHQVWTAIQVSHMVNTGTGFGIRHQQRATVETDVTFIQLSDAMMADYWQSGEPQDKAGGYAIQGLGAAWVKSISGSYSNVVGLPLVETMDLLRKLNALAIN